MYVPSQSVFMINYESGGIFSTSSTVYYTRISAGVTITNVNP